MSNWSNISKHASSLSNAVKHAVTVLSQFKGSGPWYYDQSNFTYNQTVDPISSDTILYDQVGYGNTYTNQTKH